MRVIVCGAGKVGTSIAEQLVSQNNDVTVIDQSEELISKLSDPSAWDDPKTAQELNKQKVNL